jgi:hypothetical protein
MMLTVEVGAVLWMTNLFWMSITPRVMTSGNDSGSCGTVSPHHNGPNHTSPKRTMGHGSLIRTRNLATRCHLSRGDFFRGRGTHQPRNEASSIIRPNDFFELEIVASRSQFFVDQRVT